MQNIIVDHPFEGPTSDYSTATEIPWNNKSIRLEYTLLRVVQTIGAHVADHKEHDDVFESLQYVPYSTYN